jgi:phosphopantothenoylcysteine decarboxylase / phosphopantothenate---cysteine ligase
LTSPLKDKKTLVTAGPTYEAIDPVRFIGNHSSGKMGIAIAKELQQRGAHVTLVLGPSSVEFSAAGLDVVRVTTAEEMYQASLAAFDTADLAVMAAAVADFSPVTTATEKIKKKEENLTIELARTKDILKTLGERKRKGQVLTGFALETNNGKQYAVDKLKKKNADMIVLNSLQDAGAGFGHDTNKITIFDKGGQEFNFDTLQKTEVAKNIVDTIIRLYYA